MSDEVQIHDGNQVHADSRLMNKGEDGSMKFLELIITHSCVGDGLYRIDGLVHTIRFAPREKTLTFLMFNDEAVHLD